jgi:zinc transport system substrate-binding protein
VVTVRPLAGIVERLAGGAAEVRVLVPPGADVETFAPTPRDVAALERARLAVTVGDPAVLFERLHLDPWLADHPDVPRIRLADAPGSAADPHLWLSPRAVAAVLPEIARHLSALVPAAAGAIAARRDELAREAAALDRELARRFAGATARSFVIQHPSLECWARDYGLTQIAIEAEGKEPSPARLAALVERARAGRASAVLVQRGVPGRGGEIVAAAIGARTIEIDPMDADWLASLRRIADAVAAALFEG